MSALALALVLGALASQEPAADEEGPPLFSAGEVANAARVIGAEFTADELQMMLADVSERLEGLERLRAPVLDNGLEPALYFLPWRAQRPGEAVERASRTPPADAAGEAPAQLEELAYASIEELSRLIHARALSCEDLAHLHLGRLMRLDETLHCVVELCEERALEQARALDAELAAGKSRGLLHGIPWVAKDLLSVKGTRTTWGAKPFEEQRIEADATVVQRLDEAGAVLIAKVTLGALAMGDVWFGGQTKNPWNVSQGSSGSSAGPAAAVAAGCAAFGIGSETLGSIVSPSTRCGNSSLRPTFGRVPRGGAMTLCWSMDKLGPMCRSAADAAIVFDAIHGADPLDPSSVWAPFELAPASSVEGWKVGFVESHFDEESPHGHVLDELRGLGVELVPVDLPDYPVDAMLIVLEAEAAAAFDTFSAGSDDDALVRQGRGAWPNLFRHARLIPAVDYVRANRLRTLLTADWEQLLRGVDAIVHPSYAGGILSATNLTGHPTFVAPDRFKEDGAPDSISFTARHFGDARLVQLVRAWQATTDYEDRHPGM